MNKLRNRLIHRGTYILHYSTIDSFIGKFIIPLTFKIVTLPDYKNREKYWKYQPLSCGIDPLEQIVNEYKNKNPKILKIAYLKELGRAAYENPNQRRVSLIDDGSKKRAELLASFELKDDKSGIFDVKSCPVCRAQSLMRFSEIKEGTDELIEHGKFTLVVNRVKCLCCTFEVTDELRNAKELDLPLDNYWLEQEVFI